MEWDGIIVFRTMIRPLNYAISKPNTGKIEKIMKIQWDTVCPYPVFELVSIFGLTLVVK